MEVYAESIDPKIEDPNFYHALINIKKEKFDDASLYIDKCRKQIESFLIGINSQNYHNSYNRFVRLMILSEMEEIMDFKKFEINLKEEKAIGSHSFNGK